MESYSVQVSHRSIKGEKGKKTKFMESASIQIVKGILAQVLSISLDQFRQPVYITYVDPVIN
jgi:hypothetical protein